jgi:Coenzyme PQQ synthesis protein D (PqqD)
MSNPLTWNPDVVARRLGDASVLVDLRTNRIFELNLTAARLWELADGRRTVDEIIDILTAEFEASGVDVRAEVRQLIDALRTAGLTSANP